MFVVNCVVNSKHETVERLRNGYRAFINYFGLSEVIMVGKLLFAQFLGNERVLFHGVLNSWNRLYGKQIED